eukprot:TRINITY_DN20405_c0_g1_i1.p1 TRINITY_DN20405_c0_g1~~TRINITY_DN20405_c0_g1_i1.p1  ORF type:complete len:159 (-),score=28.63 TRINITY_DN20405_c0_g1_i1:861-1337(-)
MFFVLSQGLLCIVFAYLGICVACIISPLRKLRLKVAKMWDPSKRSTIRIIFYVLISCSSLAYFQEHRQNGLFPRIEEYILRDAFVNRVTRQIENFVCLLLAVLSLGMSFILERVSSIIIGCLKLEAQAGRGETKTRPPDSRRPRKREPYYYHHQHHHA